MTTLNRCAKLSKMGRISPEDLRQTVDPNKELFHKEYPNWELTRGGSTLRDLADEFDTFVQELKALPRNSIQRTQCMERARSRFKSKFLRIL